MPPFGSSDDGQTRWRGKLAATAPNRPARYQPERPEQAVPICYNWMTLKTDNGKLERHERRFSRKPILLTLGGILCTSHYCLLWSPWCSSARSFALTKSF